MERMENIAEYLKVLFFHAFNTITIDRLCLTVVVAVVWILLLFPKLRRFFLRNLFRILRTISVSLTIKRHGHKLSPASESRLSIVRKKTLVLDMDETLMTAIVKGGHRLDNEMNVPFDYRFTMFDSAYTVFVYKRPHLDYFLDTVSQWYNLVVYTTSTKLYADPILTFLDNGRGILRKRLYRHNCSHIHGVRIKPVSRACADLSSVFILDNSLIECTYNKGNAIKINSYVIGSLMDNNLLYLLPFLDCLRFVEDVRSILKPMNTNSSEDVKNESVSQLLIS
ncbi:CTD nuclear envelope phosphatase 1 homolog [Drosophila obscura]|uniref:CTD nuclear envelope phosphatase 1 homolog n=1 Tax=Drosophila obscura TaxID=7282 RepID=UPI001BB25C24|nr:CTD nuclear envelope phosphatase 1 homolog [Drosophila obscura]